MPGAGSGGLRRGWRAQVLEGVAVVVHAVLTGLYACEDGVYNNRTRLAERHRTLAEALRGVGYRTELDP
jgi:hypothetical protein